MVTLLLRLAGPMQSWGTQSEFTNRDTELDPSFSGVVGLLAAALGRGRNEPIGDLAALAMGVRVEREGVRMVDYHTAGGVRSGSQNRYGVYGAGGNAVISHRHYLADADFIVALEGARELLEDVDAGLGRPRWPLFLGRRAFVPSVPVRWPRGGGLVDGSVESTLRRLPWTSLREDGKKPQRLRLVLSATPETASEVRLDVPLSFVSRSRRFAPRYLRTEWMALQEVAP